MASLLITKDPNRKPRHLLSGIDVKNMTATCAVCGQIDIRKKKVRQYTVYICATQKREYRARYFRLNYTPHPRKYGPSSHILSEVDYENKTAVCSRCGFVKIYVAREKNTMHRRCYNARRENTALAKKRRQKANKPFINKYKLQKGCQNCGYKTRSRKLEFHARNQGEKDPAFSWLAKFARERLIRELEKCDVLCVTCHQVVHIEQIK